MVTLSFNLHLDDSRGKTVEGGVNDDLREGRRASRDDEQGGVDDEIQGRSRRRDSREESTNLGVDDEIQGRSRRISESTTRFKGGVDESQSRRRESRDDELRGRNERKTSREISENPSLESTWSRI
ncbi:uncharacterized protein A4U43_C08F15910 [Asparagus officinalis]|nr:uncharacterized protein A4U43_C08F15910 [Asparagus officinalis]